MTHVFVPIPRSLHFIRDAADHPYEVLLSAQLLSHRDANHAEQRSEQQLVALPELNVISGLLQHPVMCYDKIVNNNVKQTNNGFTTRESHRTGKNQDKQQRQLQIYISSAGSFRTLWYGMVIVMVLTYFSYLCFFEFYLLYFILLSLYFL